MLFSEIKDQLDSLVIPLHDVEWCREKVRHYLTHAYAYPPSEEEIEKDVSAVSNGLIVGYPDPEDDNVFSFGFKDEGYLDDRSMIDTIINPLWGDALEHITILGTMESCSEVWYDNDFEDLTTRTKIKEIDDFLTHLIGRSLSTEESMKIASTSDCKKFIEEHYGYTKMKRTATNKWGNLNYRFFENDDGNTVSIVAYNGKLISHYEFEYKN